MIPVHIVAHDHIERSCGGALFLVPAHVQIIVIGPAVSQAMNQPRIAMIRKDDRLIGGKKRVEILVRQTVWMLLGRLKFHKIDNIDEANSQIVYMLPEEVDRRKRFQSRNISGACHYNV